MQNVIGQLAQLILRFGSVNACAQSLSDALRTGARIYPNRIHGLFNDDPSRGVNTATLDLLEEACSALDKSLAPSDWVINPDSVRSAAKAELVSHDLDVALDRVAEKFAIPPGVVRTITRDMPTTPVISPVLMPTTEPDWSWQDTAVSRCINLLKRGDAVKAGLILPTGSGKTRVALRVALDWLRGQPSTDVVLWVTHRHHLRRQARRTLHALIRESTLPAEEATAAFDRVRFVMTTNLAAELADSSDRISLVIVDEAHHAAAPSYESVVSLQTVPGLFLTATPNRADALPIGIDEIVYTITYRELFERGCVTKPVFDPPEDMPGLDWSSPTGVSDLADYLLERTETDFSKPLVAVSLRERAEILYEALQEHLDARPSHPLTSDDIGFVHGGRNSRGVSDASDFLDEFSARPAGILIATSQLVGEGFDDPSIDAAVITYPSTSIGHLMQVAGRALRWAPGKSSAHVVQVRESPLQYYFEQRWLYQDISDTLRPDLIDLTYRSNDDLSEQIQHLLNSHHVPAAVTRRIMSELAAAEPGRTMQLMLTGLSYYGHPDSFEEEGRWGAILVSPTERDRFIRIFNDISARSEDLKEQQGFLAAQIPQDLASGSLWRSYADLIPAMEYARREITDVPYHGRENRNHRRGHNTTWLKYITFEFKPSIPAVLEAFIDDAFNRDSILAAYAGNPIMWRAALRLELPVFASEVFLLNEEQTRWMLNNREALTADLATVPREDALGEFGRWRGTVDACPLPLRVIDNFQQFLRPERQEQHLVLLDHNLE